MEPVLTPTAEHLDIEGLKLNRHPDNDTRKFPDGEVYIQLEEVAELEEALVVHSGMPDPNTGLSYLYGLLELLRQEGVKTEVFFTYFPYGMQDSEFYPGNLNYAKSITEKLEEYYGVGRVHAIDPHFGHAGWLENHGFRIINSFPVIEDHHGLDRHVVIGPDMGAVQRFGIESYSKQRKNVREVEIAGEIGKEVAGTDVLVFDDLIETGGTMKAAYEKLKQEGASTVEAAAVHGVLEEGVEKVSETYDGFYLTNSIQNSRSSVPVEPLVRKAADR